MGGRIMKKSSSDDYTYGLKKGKDGQPIKTRAKRGGRPKMMGGGMTMMPRAMYGKGGGVCKRGMGRAYGKNS